MYTPRNPKMSLTEMYEEFKRVTATENRPISPLYSSLWIAKTFGYSYEQARKLFRMFWRRLANGI